MLKKYSTETIVDHDLEALADLMAKNPEFASKLADGVAKRVGEELETRGWDGAGIDEKLDKALAKLSRQGELLETMHGNIQDLRGRHSLLESDIRKASDRLDSISRHLGINTDTRRKVS